MSNLSPTFAASGLSPRDLHLEHRDSLKPEAEFCLSRPQIVEMIRKHYAMQRGGFISECEEAKNGFTIYSDVSAAAMWNHAAWIKGSPEDFADFVERARTQQEHHRRRPVLYYVSDPAPTDGVTPRLLEEGYEKFDVEAWMIFHKPESLQEVRAGKLDVIQARTATELSDFVDVFSAAYQVQDSPYGSALRRQAAEPGASVRVRHFVGYAEATAVCIATLIEHDGDACIYNVGTLPGARNRGHAAILMAHMINEVLASDHTRLFLQVTRGSAAERLYLKLGFHTVFTREGYRLKDWVRKRTERSVGWREDVRAPSSYLSFLQRENARADFREERPAESVALPRQFGSALRDAARKSDVTPEAVLMAAWAYLLSRYSNEQSVSFGLRLACAGDEPGRRAVLPCEIAVPTEEETGGWLKGVEQIRIAVSGREASPGPDSAAGLNDGVRGEFESVIDFGETPLSNQASPASNVTLAFIRSDADSLSLVYDPGLFEARIIRQMGDHLSCVVSGMRDAADRPILSLEMLPRWEHEQLLIKWNEPSQPRSSYRSISQQFESQAERTPEAIAIVFAGQNGHGQDQGGLTYSQLNRRVNQWANHLRARGVGPDVFVGLCLERSVEMVIALLAISKAGGAVVPLDPAFPKERIAHMVADTRMPVLVTQQHLASSFKDFPVKLICTDTASAEIALQDQSNPVPQGTPENVAYIIYTSGSTGTPKGVLISQRSIAAHCLDVTQYYELAPQDRVLQFASLSFDAAFEQILATLASGACLVVRGSEIWNPKEFAEQLSTLKLSVVDLPTAYWHRLALEWASNPESIAAGPLRLVIVGGEAMLPETLHHWRQTPLGHVRLINAYGPTEATITATATDISSTIVDGRSIRRIPIGRPRGGRKIFILDKLRRLAPIGIAGELYIGGDMLAGGYLNRPGLTKEKFIPDPFSEQPGGRLYRTGDLVRYLPDGEIEFLGRVDDQVKIRGFRIELGEIETVLNQHSGVKEAAVVARQDGDAAKQLVAYFVSRQDPGPTAKELHYFLKQKLPDYMVPARFVMLEALPLTPTGKVDRRGLPAPSTTSEEDANSVKGPSEPLELRLQLIFEKVLNRRPIGVNVSFFELGGDSLQALDVIVGIERAIGKSLPLETLYQSSTIEGLAKVLATDGRASEWSSLVPLQTGGIRPPFFLIHTTPGDVLGYGNLIYHLGPDQPCYGLQSLGLSRSELSQLRIQDMAAHYIGALRSFQPRGPYYLGGWCYGGIVAVEMAHQLLRSGEQVALLALLETVAAPPSLKVPRYFFHRLGCVLRMKPSRWKSYLKEKINYCRQSELLNRNRFRQLEKPANGKSEIANEKLARLQHVYDANLTALKQYRSSPYPGRVTLFNAAELDPALIPDRYYGWVGLADEIEIYTVPGNHDSMLTEPHVSSLAEKLQACLRRAQMAENRV